MFLKRLERSPSGCPGEAGAGPRSITWTRNKKWSDWAAISEGCYLLRSNLTETEPATLWMRRAGLGNALRTVIEEFAKIRNGDVVLQAKMADGSKRTIRLRCVTTPDGAQRVLLTRLDLDLPKRLKRVDEIEQM